MKSNIRDWNIDMKLRLLDKISKWHLKYFDKESSRFSKPSVYNWSGRNYVDYNENHIKSPDYMWTIPCRKIERHIDKFRGRQVYHNNIKKFLAVNMMKRVYEMYVFLDDYKYRIQKMIDICTEAYKEKVQSDMRRNRMRELERKAYNNFWTSDEIEKKREVVCTEFHYVSYPYTFPIIKEIEDAMSDLVEIICNFRSEFDIKKDFEPIFIEAFGHRTAEYILYGN